MIYNLITKSFSIILLLSSIQNSLWCNREKNSMTMLTRITFDNYQTIDFLGRAPVLPNM